MTFRSGRSSGEGRGCELFRAEAAHASLGRWWSCVEAAGERL